MFELTEIAVPFIFFASMVTLVWLVLAYRFKQKKLLLGTFETLMRENRELPPESIAAIATNLSARYADLRKAIICLAISLSVCVFAYLIDLPDRDNVNPTRALIGLGLCPGIFGCAFLVLHWIQGHHRQR